MRPRVHWLETIVSAAWLLAWGLFLLFASSAAVAQFSCIPKTVMTPTGTGSRIVAKTSPVGDWRYIWCPDPAAGIYADGKPVAWRVERHAVLAKYRGTTPSTAQALWAILNAPDPLVAINDALTGAHVIPTDPHEKYEFRVLLRDACLDAYSPPYIVDITPGPGPFCGAAPIPPGPPTVTWITQPGGNSLYTVINGALAAKIAGRTAAPGVACDCTTPIVRGTLTYCPLAGGVPSEVTSCKKVTP